MGWVILDEEGRRRRNEECVRSNNNNIIKKIVDSKRERRNHTLSHTRRDIIYLHTFYTMGVRIQGQIYMCNFNLCKSNRVLRNIVFVLIRAFWCVFSNASPTARCLLEQEMVARYVTVRSVLEKAGLFHGSAQIFV